MLINNRVRWYLFWPLMFYDLIRWFARSKGLPLPFLLKRKILLDYIKKNGLDYFVETGTCYGDMLAGIKNHVKRAISIEVDEALFLTAQNRFKNDGFKTYIVYAMYIAIILQLISFVIRIHLYYKVETLWNLHPHGALRVPFAFCICILHFCLCIFHFHMHVEFAFAFLIHF